MGLFFGMLFCHFFFSRKVVDFTTRKKILNKGVVDGKSRGGGGNSARGTTKEVAGVE